MINTLLLVVCSVHTAYTLQIFMQPQMILNGYYQALERLYDYGSLGKLLSKPLGLCPLCQMPYLVCAFTYAFGITDWISILVALLTVVPYYQLLVRVTN